MGKNYEKLEEDLEFYQEGLNKCQSVANILRKGFGLSSVAGKDIALVKKLFTERKDGVDFNYNDAVFEAYMTQDRKSRIQNALNEAYELMSEEMRSVVDEIYTDCDTPDYFERIVETLDSYKRSIFDLTKLIAEIEKEMDEMGE